MVVKFLVLIVCLVGLCNAVSIKPRAVGDLKCGVKGEYSLVTCVTKTQFEFAFGAPLVKCPPGMVCVDKETPCVPEGSAEPVCRNEVIGGGACNSCLVNEANVPVCISQTKYALCRNGKVDTSVKFDCGPSLYCHADYGAGGVLQSICSNGPTIIIDCAADNGEEAPGPGPDPGPGTGTGCTAEGYFANTTDTTCRGYTKCTKNADGTFKSESLSCQVGFSFNSATKRCVPSTSYQCTQ